MINYIDASRPKILTSPEAILLISSPRRAAGFANRPFDAFARAAQRDLSAAHALHLRPPWREGDLSPAADQREPAMGEIDWLFISSLERAARGKGDIGAARRVSPPRKGLSARVHVCGSRPSLASSFKSPPQFPRRAGWAARRPFMRRASRPGRNCLGRKPDLSSNQKDRPKAVIQTSPNTQGGCGPAARRHNGPTPTPTARGNE